MNHYYRNDDSLKSKERILKLYILDRQLEFYSDIGVFSNTKIDYGSYTFLKTLLLEENTDSLLDVGCGYGTLGITMRYFDKCQNLDMVDVNLRAVELCKKNVLNYQLKNTNVFYSDGFTNVSKTYDRIVINPPIRAGKEIIYKMFEDSIKYLDKKGALYIVIKKDLGALSAIKKLQEIYQFVEVLKKDKGYYIIKSFN